MSWATYPPHTQDAHLIDERNPFWPEVRRLRAIRDLAQQDYIEASERLSEAEARAVNPARWPVDFLALPTSVKSALSAARIRTVGQLLAHSEKDLLTMRGFGGGASAHVKLCLATHGLALSE